MGTASAGAWRQEALRVSRAVGHLCAWIVSASWGLVVRPGSRSLVFSFSGQISFSSPNFVEIKVMCNIKFKVYSMVILIHV